MILTEKINQTKKIIKRYLKKKDVGIFWSGGKDSTLLLYLIRECLENKDWPSIIILASDDEFPEIVEFIKRVTEKWKLPIVKFSYSTGENVRETRENKARLVTQVIKKLGLKYILDGIRASEHPARAESKIIAKRKGHIRVHPIHMLTTAEVWEYTKSNGIPYCGLYNQGYTALGEKKYTQKSTDIQNERSSRKYQEGATNMESYSNFKRLKQLGYFV